MQLQPNAVASVSVHAEDKSCICKRDLINVAGFVHSLYGGSQMVLFPLIRRRDCGGDIGRILWQSRLFQNGLTLSVCAGKELMADEIARNESIRIR